MHATAPGKMPSLPLTRVQWLICVIAAIGFAFNKKEASPKSWADGWFAGETKAGKVGAAGASFFLGGIACRSRTGHCDGIAAHLAKEREVLVESSFFSSISGPVFKPLCDGTLKRNAARSVVVLQ